MGAINYSNPAGPNPSSELTQFRPRYATLLPGRRLVRVNSSGSPTWCSQTWNFADRAQGPLRDRRRHARALRGPTRL